MKNILEKIDETEVDMLALLSADDRDFCINILDKCTHHLEFISDLLRSVKGVWDLHKKNNHCLREDFQYQMDKMEDQLESLQKIENSLHERMIDLVETHFRSKYSISFVSYLEILNNKKEAILNDLAPIIDNMLNQVGSDLLEAGTVQIIKRFQDKFQYSRTQPELKNSQISFPNYYHLGYGASVHLDYDEKSVSTLLNAIALILFDTSVLPERYSIQLSEWKNQLEYNKVYLLETDLKIRFFKNRRVDIIFPSLHTAEKFWQFFQLENIVELNNAKS